MDMQSVRGIAVSQPLIGCGANENAEDLIAYCARVSNPSNQLNSGTASKLIAYLVRNEHWSPFEMVSMTMEIVTTRDIARQILRHRSFSFQEFSQRYAAVVAPSVIRETRLQDTANRQNSTETEDVELAAWWIRAQGNVAKSLEDVYRIALEKGIAKEVARVVLPEGMTRSSLYMAGSVRSWIHYINLRRGNGTQKEHRDVANKCRDVLLQQFPSLSEVV
jgi:thymidylate synthase (FAD)